MGDENRRSGGDEGFSDFFSEEDFVDAPRSEPKPKPKADEEREPAAKPKPKPESKRRPESKPEPEPAADEPKRERTKRPSLPRPQRVGGAKPILRYGLPIAAFLVISSLAIGFSKPSGEQVLSEAAQSFSKIDRGIFGFELTVSPRGGEGAQPASISLSGPFELPPDTKLPVARIDYTVSSGGQQQTTTLTMTGDKAYVEVQGQAFELPAEATKDLEKSAADLRKQGEDGGAKGLGGVRLDFDKWLTDPEVRNGGEVGGQKTWEVDADVDVVEALTDLLAQAKAFGSITGAGQLPAELSKQDARELRKLIERAYVRVNVGKYDDLLRRFDLTMDVKPPKDKKDQSLLTSGRANLVISISDPNQPVDVEAPKDALPYAALESLTKAAGATSATR
jgi:hypothetical protein